MKIPMTKKITMETSNGEMEFLKIEDSYHLTYHNPVYKNNPFKVPTSFSTDFTIEQIMNSHEVSTFMCRFD